jgi:hypothetical protein
MNCNKCNHTMAQIPYVEHQKRMYKSYEKIDRLVSALVITNLAWFFVCGVCLLVR